MKQIGTDSFSQHPSEIEARDEILQLARTKQPHLATKFEDLLGDGGPPEETADEMIRAFREWRQVQSTRSLT